MKKDLTTGNVFQTILYFALPYLLSYFLQTLYGMADLYIIGQFNGVAATTAVSIGSQVMHMLTVIIVGLAMGTTVTVGRAIGAKKTDEASLAIGNTVTLFIIVSVVFTLGLLLLLKPIVALISTPQEAVQGTIQYLFVCFIGIPFITAYNIISSIFRGLGDSKSPMYFVAVACVANIGLDYLFIGVMSMGPVGAALGTTLAQTISVAISLIAIHKKQIGVHLTKKDFKPQVSVMKMLLSIGVPVALQDGFIQVAFIVITIIANQRGLNPAAAVGIVEKFISAAFIVPSSMLATVSALAAQNIGADKHDRAAKTLYTAMLITSVYGILIGLVTEVAAEYILGFFTKDAVVIVLGSQYLRAYIWDAFLLYRLFLCLRTVLYWVYPQCACDCTGAYSRGIFYLEMVPGHIVPDGNVSAGGVSFICTHLYCVLYLAEEKEGHLWKKRNCLKSEKWQKCCMSVWELCGIMSRRGF